MNYQETVKFLFNSIPCFQKIGKDAYKSGLKNSLALDKHFDHPHKNYPIIHIAGTNGKGSCSHSIASVLQESGYKVGLFTSPHLLDFRERIRVNGEMIPEKFVINFVENEKNFFQPLAPSFFELTTAMAYYYFAQEKVDIAVIEVGLGGRLDCTNIANPILSIITNISLEHTQFLGDTISAIAKEKAGIIKDNTPVVIGEKHKESTPIFITTANEHKAPITFAEDHSIIKHTTLMPNGLEYETTTLGTIFGDLGGIYQIKNTNTVFCALEILKGLNLHIDNNAIISGLKNVKRNTHLLGRWQKVEDQPQVICDTGHNYGGIKYIVEQLKRTKYDQLYIIFGILGDKDVDKILKILPKEATYYFTQPNNSRALAVTTLLDKATKAGLKGTSFTTLPLAYEEAHKNAKATDLIYVGGSSFMVSDFLGYLKTKNN